MWEGTECTSGKLYLLRRAKVPRLWFRWLSAWPRAVLDAACSGDNQIGDQTQEQAMLHNSGPTAQAVGQRGGIGNGAEVAVEDHVAGVGNKLRAARILADRHPRLQRLQEAQLALPAKSEHFYGNWVP